MESLEKPKSDACFGAQLPAGRRAEGGESAPASCVQPVTRCALTSEGINCTFTNQHTNH